MLEIQNKDSFYQTLSRFSTSELENIAVKFPYFQQVHLLLAKKYQLENNPKFDEQLQLAALYTQDREFFFSLFSEKEIVPPIKVEETPQPVFETPKEEVVVAPEIIPVEEEKKEEVVLPVVEKTEEVIEQETAPVEEPVLPEIPAETKTETTEEVVEEKKEPSFSFTQPHTFDEWLKVFSTGTKTSEETTAAKQDEELNKIIMQSVPANVLQELVEGETHYSRGLNEFIEEQVQKHKHVESSKPKNENEIAPEMITETLAKLYEGQKKFAKAIRAYELLAMKFPEKNDLFAARIQNLKNQL